MASNSNIEKYEREYDLNKVAELRYGLIPELEAQIKTKEEDIKENYEGALLKEEVTESEVSEIVANWTGIPVTKLV